MAAKPISALDAMVAGRDGDRGAQEHSKERKGIPRISTVQQLIAIFWRCEHSSFFAQEGRMQATVTIWQRFARETMKIDYLQTLPE